MIEELQDGGGTPYVRLSGGGNDFLALVEPTRAPKPAEISAWCTRGLGVGSDGLFVLRRAHDGEAAVTMDYFNADGQPASLCLNGTRCAARLAFELGWNNDQEQIEVRTGAGPIAAQRRNHRSVALTLPAIERAPRVVSVDLDDQIFEGFLGLVGVPHFVITWDDSLAHAPVTSLGPRLRAHELFGDEGANVSFVRYPSPERLEIRTFERGVEAETLACGTGVVAAAAVGVLTKRTTLPVQCLTQGGFELTVEGEASERLPKSWTLVGDARIVAHGELTLEASTLPSPPDWSP